MYATAPPTAYFIVLQTTRDKLWYGYFSHTSEPVGAGTLEAGAADVLESCTKVGTLPNLFNVLKNIYG